MLYVTQVAEVGSGGDTLFANMHLTYDVPRTEQPLVIRHPDTGLKLLFINKPHMSAITQLSTTESTAVLDML
ncbi:dioxygenase-like protein [Streptomyces lincolnensis]|uniref:Dioxygenase-like protein n=1 Tax=Streptomyces lincolnensis TaxID=1915 RepID=A0A1B1MP45_STRLN|nr:dioxygenase-like protein [Streptomyces lincolnensis]AXG59049.1 dioxygenase [Streptomyces lincolnensis]